MVQKYGGSSLADADAIRRVARRIARSSTGGDRVVAVVSAMGDTTDRLIKLAEKVAGRPDTRELDALLATGELQSCTLMAMALHSLGCGAISLSGAQAGIRTDSRHRGARISVVQPERITRELESGKIVIVAGFQGITDDLDVTTLERGGSDTTAVAVAAGLGASRCEIYTDVDGIYTANPRIVPEAHRLDEIGFEEMLELASYGAKFPPQAIEMALVYDVPILVASSFRDGPGTMIHKESNVSNSVGQIRNRVRAIATDANVGKITARGLPDRVGLQADIFGPLADADISVDVIVQNAGMDGGTDLSFTVERTDLNAALEVAAPVCKALGASQVTRSADLAKVTIVGTGMQNMPGYASRMFRALADAGIAIELISTSEIRITCVVREERMEDAARALHRAFELESVG